MSIRVVFEAFTARVRRVLAASVCDLAFHEAKCNVREAFVPRGMWTRLEVRIFGTELVHYVYLLLVYQYPLMTFMVYC